MATIHFFEQSIHGYDENHHNAKVLKRSLSKFRRLRFLFPRQIPLDKRKRSETERKTAYTQRKATLQHPIHRSESTVDIAHYQHLWVSFIRVRTLIEYRINCSGLQHLNKDTDKINVDSKKEEKNRSEKRSKKKQGKLRC